MKEGNWWSNNYPCKIRMNNELHGSVNEIIDRYKEDPRPYKDIETVQKFGIYLKFLQNRELRQKLLLTKDEDFGNIKELKIIKRLLWSYSSYLSD